MKDPWDDEILEKVLDEFLGKIRKPSLQKVLEEWWEDVFTEGGSDKATIENLLNRIEEWLPPEHPTNSYDWDRCLRMIKSKLRG